MAATRSALQHSVFQTDDERLLGFVNISSVNDKRKKKETFLCVTASTQQPIVVKLYFIRAKDDGFYKKDSFMLRDVRMVDGINPRKPSTTFHIYIGEKKQVFNAATLEEKEAFVQELYLLAEKYLPVQKPEFVNISIPVVDLSPKVTDYTEDRHATPEDEYQPITLREEADFVQMLNEFHLGISEASIFHEKLTKRLQELDNTNIESIMTSEQAVTKLIEDLDKCEEKMNFLSERLQAYDDVLNQVEESIETIEEKAKLEATERENMGKLLTDLEDFTRLVTQVSPEHLELLQRPKFGDQASINQTADAVRRSCNFLAVETPNSQLKVYRDRTQLVREALSRFMDTFYSYVSALMDKMRNHVPLDNAQMMPKHSAVYRQYQVFSEIIQLIKENKPIVYQRFLDTYQQNAAAIFTQDIQVFYENMRQEMQSKPVNSLQDLEEIARLLEVVLGESSTVVEAEQKFLSKCMHIPPTDNRANPPQLSDQMRNALKPIFEQLPQSFHTFSRSCASKGHLVVATLFVRLVSLLKKYTDNTSYFSVLFGNFVVGMKQAFDEQMNSTLDSYMMRKFPKKKIGVLPIIDNFKQLMLTCDQIFEKSERRSDLEKWAVKLCHAIIETIDMAASNSGPKYPPQLVRFENFHHLHLTLLELRKLESLESTRNSVKKKYAENQRYYVYDQLGRPLEKLHIYFESIENAIKSGIKPEEVSYQEQFSKKSLKTVISEYPGNEVRKNLENLYSKVEKHLGRDSPLLQVVWHDMQADFLNQLKNYQAIIGRCYPNSRINLEFTIEDVLGYFSAIAQKH